MNKLIFKFKNSNSIEIPFANYDFINSIKVGDDIKIKNDFFVVQRITIDRSLVPTNPMTRPTGFYYVVVMSVDLL